MQVIGGGGKKALDIIWKSDIGERFIVAFDTLKPYLSVLLVDYPVPDDIQEAPQKGWKEIPNWDNERKNGNTGELWDRSKVEKPEFKRDIKMTWAITGVMLFLLLIVLRDIIEFFEELPEMLKKFPGYIQKLWKGK